MLITGPKVIGSHAHFFRAGQAFTVPSAGTCGQESKPGAADPAWINLGVVEDASTNLETAEVKIFRPSPGRRRLYQVKPTSEELLLKLTLAEVGPFGMELLYRTLNLDGASTQFNPLEGIQRQGWLKLQQYDSDDVLFLVMDTFVRLQVAGEVNFGGTDLAKPQLEALVLHSTLNTASI